MKSFLQQLDRLSKDSVSTETNVDTQKLYAEVHNRTNGYKQPQQPETEQTVRVPEKRFASKGVLAAVSGGLAVALAVGAVIVINNNGGANYIAPKGESDATEYATEYAAQTLAENDEQLTQVTKTDTDFSDDLPEMVLYSNRKDIYAQLVYLDGDEYNLEAEVVVKSMGDLQFVDNFKNVGEYDCELYRQIKDYHVSNGFYVPGDITDDIQVEDFSEENSLICSDCFGTDDAHCLYTQLVSMLKPTKAIFKGKGEPDIEFSGFGGGLGMFYKDDGLHLTFSFSSIDYTPIIGEEFKFSYASLLMNPDNNDEYELVTFTAAFTADFEAAPYVDVVSEENLSIKVSDRSIIINGPEIQSDAVTFVLKDGREFTYGGGATMSLDALQPTVEGGDWSEYYKNKDWDKIGIMGIVTSGLGATDKQYRFARNFEKTELAAVVIDGVRYELNL